MEPPGWDGVAALLPAGGGRGPHDWTLLGKVTVFAEIIIACPHSVALVLSLVYEWLYSLCSVCMWDTAGLNGHAPSGEVYVASSSPLHPFSPATLAL